MRKLDQGASDQTSDVCIAVNYNMAERRKNRKRKDVSNAYVIEYNCYKFIALNTKP